MQFNLGQEIFSHAIEDIASCEDIDGYLLICSYKDGKVGHAWHVGNGSISTIVSTAEAAKMRIIYNNSGVFEDVDNEDDD